LPIHRLEGAADGRTQGTQQPAWRRLVAPSPHSVGDGDAVPEMVLGDGGDGRTGPMATEVTGPAGPTSRRSSVQVWSSRPSSLRGLRRPLSRVRHVDRTGVGGSVTRDCRWPCRIASHSGGDGLTGGVGGTVPGRDSQARRGIDSSLTRAPAHVSAFNAPVGGAGMEATSP
jgi:hypothetical protein